MVTHLVRSISKGMAAPVQRGPRTGPERERPPSTLAGGIAYNTSPIPEVAQDRHRIHAPPDPAGKAKQLRAVTKRAISG